MEQLSELEASLVQANQDSVDAADLVIPILKLAQPLTDEVSTGDAKPGEFVVSLTRESLGNEIEFIVSGKEKGRFKPAKRGSGQRTRVCYGTNIVPWEDDPFYGQPFSEHPDAEEKFSAAANAPGGDWGSGPPISTTYNFTGHVVGQVVPVRLSLMRKSAPAARKWYTILDAVLRGRFWDSVFTLTSEQEKNDSGNYYTVNVKQGRKTTPEERQEAVSLAVILRDQQVAVVGDEDGGGTVRSEKAPEAADGIEV